MASYENAGAAISAVAGAMENDSISADTFEAISAILTDAAAAGTFTATDVLNDVTATTTIYTPEATQALTNSDVAKFGLAKSILMDNVDETTPGAAANVKFAANSNTEVLILNAADNHNVDFSAYTENGVTVQTGGGKNAQVTTTDLDDAVTFAGTNDGTSSATINTGDGADSVVITGAGTAVINSTGTLNVDINAPINGLQVTINAADGFDQVNFGNAQNAFNFAIDSTGNVVVTGAQTRVEGGKISTDNVDLFLFNGAGEDLGQLKDTDQAVVVADNEALSLVAKLYKIGLGRGDTGVLDGDNLSDDYLTTSGIQFWADYIKENPEIELQQLTYQMLNGDEFNGLHGKDESAEDFVTSLYETLGLDADQNVQNEANRFTTFDEYVQHIQNSGDSQIGKMDVALDMATSLTAVKVLGIDSEGQTFVIDNFTTDDGAAS